MSRPDSASGILYDWHNALLLRDQTADVAFWMEKLVPEDSAIAVLGAGTGRVAIPLAERGHPVFAVDYDWGRLKRIAPREGLHVISADFTERIDDLHARHVIFPYSALQCVPTSQRRTAALRTAAAIVRERGLVWVDASTHFGERKPRGWHLACSGFCDELSVHVQEWQRHRRTPSGFLMDIAFIADRRELYSVREYWHIHVEEQFQREVAAAGLQIGGTHSGYGRVSSHRIIYALQPHG